MTTTNNSELVAQITTLEQAWNTADHRICEMFHGWEQRSMRAGLERGFYMQIGQLPGAESIGGDMDDLEQLGRAVYAVRHRDPLSLIMDMVPTTGSCGDIGREFTRRAVAAGFTEEEAEGYLLGDPSC